MHNINTIATTNNGLLVSDDANDNVDDEDEDPEDDYTNQEAATAEDDEEEDDDDKVQDDNVDDDDDDDDHKQAEADHQNAEDVEEDNTEAENADADPDADDLVTPPLPAMAGDLILTHEQHDFYLEGDIDDLSDILHANANNNMCKLSGEFAYFYPYDGSEPSLLLIGKDFYINVTPQQQHQQLQS